MNHPSLVEDPWTLSTRFEGGAAEHLEATGRDTFRIVVRRDPAKDKNQPYAHVAYHFAVRLENRSGARRTAHISVDGINHDPGPRATVWLRRGKTFQALPGETRLRRSPFQLSFQVPMPARSGAIVSNGFPLGPREVHQILQEAAQSRPGKATLRSLGRTAEGRDIWCLSVRGGRRTRSRLLVKGTFQPSEMGGWGTFAALDWLLGKDPLARRLLAGYIVDLVPQPNPDGAAHGLCMVNALGESPMFEFAHCAAGRPVSAETAALWQWVGRHRPVAALGFHSYFQTDPFFWATPRRVFGPYLFDTLLLRAPKVQALRHALGDALLALPTGTLHHVPKGHKNFRHCFPYVLQERRDIPGFWYKLHTSVPLAQSRRRAAAVMRALARVLVNLHPLSGRDP